MELPVIGIVYTIKIIERVREKHWQQLNRNGLEVMKGTW